MYTCMTTHSLCTRARVIYLPSCFSVTGSWDVGSIFVPSSLLCGHVLSSHFFFFRNTFELEHRLTLAFRSCYTLPWSHLLLLGRKVNPEKSSHFVNQQQTWGGGVHLPTSSPGFCWCPCSPMKVPGSGPLCSEALWDLVHLPMCQSTHHLALCSKHALVPGR